MNLTRILPVVAALTAWSLPVPAAEDPPNIVLIYGDDIGYGDLSCYGATAVQTPHVDRLARGGLQFTSAYATAATCTPSRYSLLTGEYAFRQKGTGILPGNARMIIRPGRETLPGVLQRAGYTTAVVGKWHLGLGSKDEPLDWNSAITPGPREVGFDYSFIMAATGDRVPCVFVRNHHVVGLDPEDPITVSYGEPIPGEPTGRSDREALALDWSHGHNDSIVNGISRIGYMKGGRAALWKDDEMAMEFTREAVEFIEREKTNRFFLYFAAHDNHVPRVPNERFVGKTAMGPRGDAIVEFDWSVGEIVGALKNQGLLDRTLILVTSDNGPVLDDGYKDGAAELVGDHRPGGPFRAGKYSLFEGGTRMPFIAHWPGRIEPGVSDALISQVDLLASFAALVDQQPDLSEAPDSRNQLAALLGDAATGRDSLVEDAWGQALRQGDWKFIPPGRTRDQLGPWNQVRVPEPGFLFNLADDASETNNVADQYPEKLAELARQLDSILNGTPSGAPSRASLK